MRMRHLIVASALIALASVAFVAIGVACRKRTPPAWAAPGTAVRVVSYNIKKNEGGRERIAAEVKRFRPDVVLLQEVPEKDFSALEKDLGMRGVFKPHPYWPQEGLAIFSSHPLDNGRALMDDRRTFAVVAEVTIAGRTRFHVASVHLEATRGVHELIASERVRGKELDMLLADWRDAGSPPMVVGGDFNQVPFGRNYRQMTGSWTDALGKPGHKQYTCNYHGLKTRVDYVLTTPGWTASDGGVGEAGASDHRPIWAEIRAAK
jgi:endonuclease/exonuclease/phosphatase family metal-dependent hydrolase